MLNALVSSVQVVVPIVATATVTVMSSKIMTMLASAVTEC